MLIEIRFHGRGGQGVVVGCEIGAVPPFGHNTKVKTYLSKEFAEHEWVYFNIGEHTRSARIHGKDLQKAVGDCVLF